MNVVSPMRFPGTGRLNAPPLDSDRIVRIREISDLPSARPRWIGTTTGSSDKGLDRALQPADLVPLLLPLVPTRNTDRLSASPWRTRLNLLSYKSISRLGLSLEVPLWREKMALAAFLLGQSRARRASTFARPSTFSCPHPAPGRCAILGQCRHHQSIAGAGSDATSSGRRDLIHRFYYPPRAHRLRFPIWDSSLLPRSKPLGTFRKTV